MRVPHWKIAGLSIAAALGLLVGCNSNSSPAVVERDNSAINERDQSLDVKTPLDQGESPEDLRITTEIRQQVVAQPISVNAHNAKIITLHGQVTLRGPVQNQDEKDLLARIAKEVAGSDKVDNQLEVETKP